MCIRDSPSSSGAIASSAATAEARCGVNLVSVGEVQLADEADGNVIKSSQGARRKTTNAYLKDDATSKGLGVYIIVLDVFDGELLYPLLGYPFKAEPEPDDVPKLVLILDPNRSKAAPSNTQVTNIIEIDVRVVEGANSSRTSK